MLREGEALESFQACLGKPMTSGWGYLYPSVSWESSCPELSLPAHFPPAAWAGLASFNFKLQFIHFSVMILLDLTGEGLAGPSLSLGLSNATPKTNNPFSR